MEEHLQPIFNHLSESPRMGRLFYGLLAAERLCACLWAAYSGSQIWSVYVDVIEGAMNDVMSLNEPEAAQVEAWRQSLEELVPEGGEPLQAQAQYACVCLIEALSLFEEAGRDSVESITNCVVGGLDNYVFYVRRRIMADSSSPEDYALLHRELERQLADARLVSEFHKLTTEQLQERRVQNLQLIVPPAVGL